LTPKMRLRLATSASLPNIEVAERIVEEVGRHEQKTLEDNRVRLCSSVVVAEVQTLKSEVEILKRSLEEEMQARRTGDALSGEACMQLQAVLELNGKQHAASIAKLEEQVHDCFVNVREDIADLRVALEAEVLVRLQGDEQLEKRLNAGSGDGLRALRLEIEQEIRQRMGDFERLRSSLQVEVSKRESNNDKWSELSNEISDVANRLGETEKNLTRERSDRQMENRTVHQLVSTLAEQTNFAMEEESTNLMNALHNHSHDVVLEGLQVQTLSRPADMPAMKKHPRRISLNNDGRPPSVPRIPRHRQMSPMRTTGFTSSCDMTSAVEGARVGMMSYPPKEVQVHHPNHVNIQWAG